jgi:hypothetical protein
MAAQTKSKKTSETTPEMVWDIFENTWVTREYWEWVNGRDPQELDKAIYEMYSDLVESKYAQEKLKYEGLKFTQYYINTSVSNIGESVSQSFKAGDRVRVTYDTVVTTGVVGQYCSTTPYVGVQAPLVVDRNERGDKNEVMTTSTLVPVRFLTKLGPEADPTQTARAKQGKEFLVAVKKPSYDPFQHPWVIVASYDGGRLGERFSNAQVKDWDVLGKDS